MGIFIHRHLPKSYTDLGAFLFFLGAIHIIGFFELLVVLPAISKPHAESTGNYWGYHFHILNGFLIYFNVLFSLYKVITTNASIKGKVLPSILRPKWRFCYVCECNAPPRSYHCHTCKTCILRRDHHCTFTGYCIGHGNQRYYISLLLNCAIASIYSCFLNVDYLYHLFGEISVKTVVTISFPMLSWIFFRNDLVTTFQSFGMSLCLIGLCMTCGLLVYHLVNIYHGQTVYEKTFRIHTYDLGWKENFKQVFGSRWTIAWISPLITSPLSHDGIEFETKEEHESPKAM